MADSGKVTIEVLRPASPLAPQPRPSAASQTEIDSILLALPEWQDETSEGASKKAAASTKKAASRPAAARRSPPDRKPPARSPQERVRNLSLSDQQKVARTGEQSDRVALERLYGKAVWETLLHNSRLTPPEVLRIARMGSIPIPMLEIIISNRTWLNTPQVRRALLTNRRLTKDMIMTVLRATPKNELRLMQKQTAYPTVVREAAANLAK